MNEEKKCPMESLLEISRSFQPIDFLTYVQLVSQMDGREEKEVALELLDLLGVKYVDKSDALQK